MSKLKALFTISNCKNLEDVKRFTSAAFDEIQQLINGRLTLGDNLQASGPLTVALGTTPIKVMHSLSQTPSGYLVVNQDAGASIFTPDRSQYPWDKSQIFLQSTAPVTAVIYVLP